jgi:hypothetical protein
VGEAAGVAAAPVFAAGAALAAGARLSAMRWPPLVVVGWVASPPPLTLKVTIWKEPSFL